MTLIEYEGFFFMFSWAIVFLTKKLHTMYRAKKNTINSGLAVEFQI